MSRTKSTPCAPCAESALSAAESANQLAMSRVIQRLRSSIPNWALTRPAQCCSTDARKLGCARVAASTGGVSPSTLSGLGIGKATLAAI